MGIRGRLGGHRGRGGGQERKQHERRAPKSARALPSRFPNPGAAQPQKLTALGPHEPPPNSLLPLHRTLLLVVEVVNPSVEMERATAGRARSAGGRVSARQLVVGITYLSTFVIDWSLPERLPAPSDSTFLPT
jgi:hypothetical protein